MSSAASGVAGHGTPVFLTQGFRPFFLAAGLWAAAYWWLSALASREEAILYSVDSITTRGASGLVLAQHWRMMGALESVDGMLLFGISTAFMFAVIQKYWPLFESRGDPH